MCVSICVCVCVHKLWIWKTNKNTGSNFGSKLNQTSGKYEMVHLVAVDYN